jgi:hypothetical protein
MGLIRLQLDNRNKMCLQQVAARNNSLCIRSRHPTRHPISHPFNYSVTVPGRHGRERCLWSRTIRLQKSFWGIFCLWHLLTVFTFLAILIDFLCPHFPAILTDFLRFHFFHLTVLTCLLFKGLSRVQFLSSFVFDTLPPKILICWEVRDS